MAGAPNRYRAAVNHRPPAGPDVLSSAKKPVDLLPALSCRVPEGGREMIVKMDKPPRASAGDMIHLTADAGNIHCFDAASGLKV